MPVLRDTDKANIASMDSGYPQPLGKAYSDPNLLSSDGDWSSPITPTPFKHTTRTRTTMRSLPLFPNPRATPYTLFRPISRGKITNASSSRASSALRPRSLSLSVLPEAQTSSSYDVYYSALHVSGDAQGADASGVTLGRNSMGSLDSHHATVLPDPLTEATPDHLHDVEDRPSSDSSTLDAGAGDRSGSGTATQPVSPFAVAGAGMGLRGSSQDNEEAYPQRALTRAYAQILEGVHDSMSPTQGSASDEAFTSPDSSTITSIKKEPFTSPELASQWPLLHREVKISPARLINDASDAPTDAATSESTTQAPLDIIFDFQSGDEYSEGYTTSNSPSHGSNIQADSPVSLDSSSSTPVQHVEDSGRRRLIKGVSLFRTPLNLVPAPFPMTTTTGGTWTDRKVDSSLEVAKFRPLVYHDFTKTHTPEFDPKAPRPTSLRLMMLLLSHNGISRLHFGKVFARCRDCFDYVYADTQEKHTCEDLTAGSNGVGMLAPYRVLEHLVEEGGSLTKRQLKELLVICDGCDFMLCDYYSRSHNCSGVTDHQRGDGLRSRTFFAGPPGRKAKRV